jgi:hypothetical protein
MPCGPRVLSALNGAGTSAATISKEKNHDAN